jgi:hypothetical protein
MDEWERQVRRKSPDHDVDDLIDREIAAGRFADHDAAGTRASGESPCGEETAVSSTTAWSTVWFGRSLVFLGAIIMGSGSPVKGPRTDHCKPILSIGFHQLPAV